MLEPKGKKEFDAYEKQRGVCIISAKRHGREWNKMKLEKEAGSRHIRVSPNTLPPDSVQSRVRGNSNKAEPRVQHCEIKELWHEG